MYFLEQGNIDDDTTFITICLVSFNLWQGMGVLRSSQTV